MLYLLSPTCPLSHTATECIVGPSLAMMSKYVARHVNCEAVAHLMSGTLWVCMTQAYCICMCTLDDAVKHTCVSTKGAEISGAFCEKRHAGRSSPGTKTHTQRATHLDCRCHITWERPVSERVTIPTTGCCSGPHECPVQGPAAPHSVAPGLYRSLHVCKRHQQRQLNLPSAAPL